MSSKEALTGLLRKADIEINGSRPWDLQVTDERFYKRILRGGPLAVGESYMDSWWEVGALDELIFRFLSRDLEHELYSQPLIAAQFVFHTLFARLINHQSVRRAFQVAEVHYNIGNDLYTKMLDPWMQYSCGYWKEGVAGLRDAQEAKLDLIVQKLQLEPGMRVLDVGCGWGGLSKYIAERYNVSVVGITVSEEQAKLARAWVNNPSVDIIVTDYRKLETEPFDRIVSVGMFEHVGYKNYHTYMRHMHRLLKDRGIFLLHTIGSNVSKYATDPWIDKYIFPNGMLPSVAQIGDSTEKLFVMEDWHNFGTHYDKTLMSWYENFSRAWPELRESKRYDDRFYRMWDFYLRSCAGAFRARNIQLWQIVLSKDRLFGGYRSIR